MLVNIPDQIHKPPHFPDMKKLFAAFGTCLLLVMIFTACNKTDSYNSASISDYINLEVGKYIHYRLDSTRYINYGQKDTVIHYDAKDVVEAAITDNAGKPGFKIVRYLRDTASQSEYDWFPVATIQVYPSRQGLEWVEENFRYQKLKIPIQEGYNWKGNAYIDVIALDPSVDINWDYRYLDDWDYTYSNVGEPFVGWNNVLIENSITVNQRDETINDPNDPSVYSEQNFSKEVYGKGIGLVYREFFHAVYQPPVGGNPGYTDGFGVKMTIIDHN